MSQLDYHLFALINGFAGRWPWLDRTAQLLLNDYFMPTLMGVLLLALWFEGRTEPEQRLNQQGVLAATLGTILSNALLKIINQLYFRPRPFAEHPVHLLFYQPTDSAWPSNAAAIGFAIAAGVWFYNRVWGRLLLFLAVLFGLSRVLGGVHYPLDIIAGAGLGWLSAWLVQRQRQLLDSLLGLALNIAHRLKLS